MKAMGRENLYCFRQKEGLMAGNPSKCKRCGKDLVGPTCPFCTVTGVDLEALINAEEMMLSEQSQTAPVALVDLVTGKRLAVTTPVCRIGRDLGNDIAIAGDRSMSRYHLQIKQNGDEFFIEDLSSRNGTFLNGSPIAIPRKLQAGDIISAGISRYQFSLKECTVLATDGQLIDENLLLSNNPDSPPAEPRPEPVGNTSGPIQKLLGAVEQAGVETVDLEQNFDASPVETAKTDFAPSMAEFSCDEFPDSKEFTDSNEFSDSVSQQEPVQKPAIVIPREINSTQSISVSEMSCPSWLDEYVVPELQQLMQERERLNSLLEEVRQDIKQVDRKIAAAQGISQALLSGAGQDLAQGCKQVFDAFDWYTEAAQNNPFELSLKRSPKVEAVVRIVVCKQDPSTQDFEALVNQQAVVWCQSNYEPKGIMVVQVSPEKAPRQRPALSREFLESMRRKKICVVQPTQLLAIYRLIVLNAHDKSRFMELLLNTCGPLPGFMMKPQQESPASA